MSAEDSGELASTPSWWREGGYPDEDIDFKNPEADYKRIFAMRSRRIVRLRQEPQMLGPLQRYYRKHPDEFINDWGVTFDPRNPEVNRASLMPFILTKKQREWIDWVLWLWATRQNGVNEKSRDMGVTWLAVALAATLCTFRRGVVVGFGSRKEDYVDEAGTLKPILPKARMFIRHLPKEFRPGWLEWRDAPQMRINFPATGSVITGEAGDQIGRGDRTSLYFVDEFAHHPRPRLVDAALSQTTNCRIDMSSVNGMNNPFAEKRWGGRLSVFIFDWRDDPRKDDTWYREQVQKLDPVVVAQEIDRDYSASVHGVVIPGPWVKAAIGACDRLGIEPSGKRSLALDVADEGLDKNAVCRARGVEIESTSEWTGKGGDIFQTVQSVFEMCDEFGLTSFRYDSDGLGAGVRGDARIINEQRKENNHFPLIKAIAFRGSEGVVDPEGVVDGVPGNRTNLDYFANRKAQGWWRLRKLFLNTYRWIEEGVECDPDEIISISRTCPNHLKLVAELSQPTYTQNTAGKVVINKKPPGMKSPNLADAVMMHFAQLDHALLISREMSVAISAATARAGRLRHHRPARRF